VGICVMFYLTVLYIEFVPIVLERIRGRVRLPGALRRLDRTVESGLGILDRTLGKVLWVFIILGVVLSTLHQSSLGGLMVIAPSKMNPLWWTPILPLLFLLSAVAVGFPMVIFESLLASRSLGRKPELEILAPLARIVPVTLFIYLAFKIGDMTLRGMWGRVIDGSTESWMWLLEVGFGVVAPILLLFRESNRRSPRILMTAATLTVLGVALNRINVFLVAFRPHYATGPYFPSFGEVAVTAGLAAGLIFVYRVMVTVFPILPREEASRGSATGGG
jgi:Ni/Fe-hydrogenase subunit HybB-like protein